MRMQMFRLVVAVATGVGLARSDWLLVAFGTCSIVAGLIGFAHERDAAL